LVYHDDFLESFNELRYFANTAKFEPVGNPEDGVLYPGICLDLPERPETEIYEKVLRLYGKIKPRSIFLRLSTAGTPVPQQAHTDIAMGKYSMMLYLNEPQHCRGGTALIEHKETKLRRAPRNPSEVAVLARDENNYDAWSTRYLCKMKTNRACFFKAHLMHRAEPIGGFGKDATDGRLVLTFFFD
jgi:hypothetical protein